MISHPFFCLREDGMVSQEVENVHDRYHILSVACGKLT
jgi:hypothetical protein